MIINALSFVSGSRLDGDVCIVGAGVAGIVLALELGKLGYSVILVEAGGSTWSAAARRAQAGDVSGSEHEPLEDVSVRRLGGALALWGGRLLPLDSSDFGSNGARGQRWPVGREELIPYYGRANQTLGGGLFEYSMADALPGEGRLLINRHAEAVDEDKVWRWGPPVRYRSFAPALRDAPNVRLVHHCLATEVRLTSDTERVEYVAAQSAPGRRLRLNARVFILAGGGLETTRLLLASRSQRAGGIGNEHGHLGAHYITHPVAEVGELTTNRHLAAQLCSFELSRDSVYCRRFLSLSERLRDRSGLPNINFTFWSPDPHDPTHGDGVLSAYSLTKRFLISSGLSHKVAGAHRSNLGRSSLLSSHLRNIAFSAGSTVTELATWACRRWLFQRQIPALLRAGTAGKLRVRFDAEQRRDSHNHVTLSEQVDEFGMPRLKVSYRVSASDRDAYYDALTLLQRDIHHCGHGNLVLPPRQSFVEKFQLGDGTHQMGLTSMSSSPRDGVVDENCRLHSCSNVFVASTAVFPTGGAAPPTLTLVALALRLAGHLGRELGGAAGYR